MKDFIYSFCKFKDDSLAMMFARKMHSVFHLPLSQQAYEECTQLEETMQSIQPRDMHDKWTYLWTMLTFRSQYISSFLQVYDHKDL